MRGHTSRSAERYKARNCGPYGRYRARTSDSQRLGFSAALVAGCDPLTIEVAIGELGAGGSSTTPSYDLWSNRRAARQSGGD
jgi:hypothetical protein